VRRIGHSTGLPHEREGRNRDTGAIDWVSSDGGGRLLPSADPARPGSRLPGIRPWAKGTEHFTVPIAVLLVVTSAGDKAPRDAATARLHLPAADS
jgi:hypothetical protein